MLTKALRDSLTQFESQVSSVPSTHWTQYAELQNRFAELQRQFNSHSLKVQDFVTHDTFRAVAACTASHGNVAPIVRALQKCRWQLSIDRIAADLGHAIFFSERFLRLLHTLATATQQPWAVILEALHSARQQRQDITKRTKGDIVWRPRDVLSAADALNVQLNPSNKREREAEQTDGAETAAHKRTRTRSSSPQVPSLPSPSSPSPSASPPPSPEGETTARSARPETPSPPPPRPRRRSGLEEEDDTDKGDYSVGEGYERDFERARRAVSPLEDGVHEDWSFDSDIGLADHDVSVDDEGDPETPPDSVLLGLPNVSLRRPRTLEKSHGPGKHGMDPAARPRLSTFMEEEGGSSLLSQHDLHDRNADQDHDDDDDDDSVDEQEQSHVFNDSPDQVGHAKAGASATGIQITPALDVSDEPEQQDQTEKTSSGTRAQMPSVLVASDHGLEQIGPAAASSSGTGAQMPFIFNAPNDALEQKGCAKASSSGPRAQTPSALDAANHGPEQDGHAEAAGLDGTAVNLQPPFGEMEAKIAKDEVATASRQLRPRNWLGHGAIFLILRLLVSPSKARILEVPQPTGSHWQDCVRQFQLQHPPPASIRHFLAPILDQGRKHWFLLHLDASICEVSVLDSLHSGEQDLQLSVAKHMVKAVGKNWEVDGWKLTRLHGPQQDDGDDCGVYVVVSCLNIISNIALPSNYNGLLWRLLFILALEDGASEMDADEKFAALILIADPADLSDVIAKHEASLRRLGAIGTVMKQADHASAVATIIASQIHEEIRATTKSVSGAKLSVETKQQLVSIQERALQQGLQDEVDTKLLSTLRDLLTKATKELEQAQGSYSETKLQDQVAQRLYKATSRVQDFICHHKSSAQEDLGAQQRVLDRIEEYNKKNREKAAACE